MSRVPAIFKDLVIATAGPMPDQFTEEKLKQWTEMRKGRFSKDWDDSITHLLCTTEQFKSRRKNPRSKCSHFLLSNSWDWAILFHLGQKHRYQTQPGILERLPISFEICWRIPMSNRNV